MSRQYSIRSLILFFLLLTLSSSVLAANDSTSIRVGFFPMRGFHEYDNAGIPTGYDVDYLRLLQSYTDWKFQFVRTDTWDEALDLLAAGKLDLVGSAQMHVERAERFDYSAYSSGTTHAAIITLSGNNDIQYEDFASFDNVRYGCVKSYIRKDEFAQYAQTKGFTANMIWFDSTEQMRKALHSREINAMVCSVMELEKDEKVVAEFSPAPFYYITTRGNIELLEKLNNAISRLKIDVPFLESHLMDQHYPIQRIPSYSPEELAYIKKNPHVRVGFLPDRAPISTIDPESGVVSGILPDLFQLMAQESGLQFTPVSISNSVPLDLLKSKQADIVAGVVPFPGQVRDPSIRLSSPLLTGQMILLARRGEPFIPALQLKIAVPTGFRAAIDYIQTNYPSFTIKEYFSTEDCMQAVQNHAADVMIQNAYVLNRRLQGPRYRDLIVVPTASNPENLSIAIPSDTNPLLLAVLNKSIQRVSSITKDQIIINNTVAKPYSITFEDFISQYKNEILLFSILAGICLVLLSIVLWLRKKNIDLIIENEETLRNITNNINGGVITLIADKGFTITYANNGFLKLVGSSRDEYDEEANRECITYVHPEDVSIMNSVLAGNIRKGDTITLEMRILHKFGNYIPILFRGTFSRDKHDQLILFCVVVDISEQRAMIEHLKVEKERYQIVVEQSNDIIFEVDLQQYTLMCSPKFKEKFGWQMDDTEINEKMPYPLRVHPDEAELLQQMMEDILLKERSVVKQLRIRKIDGEYLWCRVLVSCIRHEGRLIKLIGKIEDIDDMVRERLRLEEISQTDALTGLCNKRALRLSMERSLKLTSGTDIESFLFFVDIDNFKAVNDTLGHPIGDQALRDVSGSLRTVFRSSDIIGRYGGDEFCIFVTRMSESLAREKAEELNARLHRTYRDDCGRSVTISASIGISHAPHHGETYVQLVTFADKALYAAKEAGKDRFVLWGYQERKRPD